MKGKILVLKGQSLYNVLRIAADDMIRAFRDHGYQVVVLDLLLEEDRDKFFSLIQEKYDLVYSFQALLFEMCLSDDKTSFYAAMKNTPVFGHIVDHPIFHNKRLATTHGDNMFIGCIDRCHVQYINKYYPGVKHAVYLSHGGFVTSHMVPYEERTIDVYFPSSYLNPVAVQEEIRGLPEVYQNISNLLIHNMIENPLLTLQDALYFYFKQINFIYSPEEFTELMSVLGVVDRYIRSYTRDRLIRELIKSGIQVTVSGSGWEKFESEYAINIHMIGENGLDFMEVLEIMGNSKFVLNHIPTYQTGMHERIFSSMRCGAICVTNDFPILYEEFIDGENIVVYSNEGLQELASTMKELLTKTDQAKEIAMNGQRIAESYHKWGDNAEKILKMLDLQL